MVLDDNETNEVEAPERSFVYESHSTDGIPKDVTHLSVIQVPRIKEHAFAELPLLVEVQLYEGLRFIGEGAFSDCFKLQQIVIPSTVEIIEELAFFRCESLVKAHLCKEGCCLKTLGKHSFGGCLQLEQISVPSSVEVLSHGTFKACIALVDVELNEGLHTIGPEAFCNCRSLARISIPSTVNTIGKSVFDNCESLMNVEIPTSLETLSDGVFTGCKSLRRLSLQRRGRKDGNNNGAAGNHNFPLSVQTIGLGAFSSCKALMQVSLSSTVDKIDEHAFSGCSSLTDIELSEGLRIIQQYAFSSCVSLSGIVIPSTTLKIGQGAFHRCTSLVGVEFSPKCKAKLFQGCFRHCEALANICLPPCLQVLGNLVEFVQERTKTMPPGVHRLCYLASQTSVSDLRNEIILSRAQGNENDEEEDVRDMLGMTPFHIVATASKLRPDLLQVLLDLYPLDHLGRKDNRDKVTMGHLVSNRSPTAISLITMILKRILLQGISSRGLEDWKTDMAHKLETVDWGSAGDNGHGVIWRRTRDEILTSLAKHAIVEVASMLELAVWNMKLRLIETTTLEQEQAGRAICRTNCGCEVVISNVMGFYSDGSMSPLSAQSAYSAMSMFDCNVHWMEDVVPDLKRHRAFTMLNDSAKG